jgi:hypothetical protein
MLLIGSLGRDRTSRSWSFEAEFPLEAWVTPVGLLTDSAVGLLPNLEAARQERSMLLMAEQKLLGRKEKEVCASNTNKDFTSS